MPRIVCPQPEVTHEKARALYNKVRKDYPQISSPAQRREAARRLGLEYDTFNKAWKK